MFLTNETLVFKLVIIWLADQPIELFKKAIFTACKIKVYYRQLNVLNIANEGADFDCKELLNFSNDIEINLRSVGKTTLRINAPNIKLTGKCVGDVTLEGKCGFIDIRHNSVGNLNAKELIADEVVIRNAGIGEINLFANNSMTISHRGVGNMFYYGNPVLKDVKHNSVGVIQHKES